MTGWRRRAALAALGLAGAVVLSAALAPLPERLSTPPSTVLTWSDGTTAHVLLAPDDRWRVAVDLDDVDPAYVDALLALEDSRFWWHPGVDPLAVVRAAVGNLRAGRVQSGASTLTMQLVRVLEPRPRTLTSKVIEVWRAIGLELRLSKREILAAYLTFAPYGRNLEGVEAAARTAFGHGADRLAPDEIAVLLAIPQDPTHRWPRPEHADRLRWARDTVADRLLAADALGGDAPVDVTRAAVRSAAVPQSLQPMPRALPHVAAWLRARPIPPGVDAPTRWDTTLDAGLQRQAERRLAADAGARRAAGVDHGVVLLADLDGTLRAVVGNTGWRDGVDGTDIPAFAVPRSPGSTLKPVIAALAIGQGLALPETQLADVPVSWAGYAPQNYDGGYRGLVRLDDALSRSLNVPFVELLADVGVDPFLTALQRAGVTSLDPTPGHYGLSAAVGGIELTPLELLGVYTTLAGDGTAHTVRLLQSDADLPAPVLAPGAVWRTRAILRQRDRPDFPDRSRLAELAPEVAWKTGTSFGHRDAWAVGFDGHHLALVWLGNLDQRSSRWLVGAEAAGAVLFDVLAAAAPRGVSPPVDPRPDDLVEVSVCAGSGHPPGPACPRVVGALALAAAAPTTSCPLHVQVEVDATTGLAVTPGCRGDAPTETRSFVRWPPHVRRWLADRTDRLPEQPTWAAGCAPDHAGAPRITHPADGAITLLRQGVSPDAQQLPLEGSASTPDGRIAWFVDGRWLGTTGPGEPTWWTPSPGAHRLVATDASGASTEQRLQVVVAP